MGESKSEAKSFCISKQVVWKAWELVRAKDGAAGVDGESIAEFEQDLKNNLFVLWNRLSSGSYMPPAVRAVQIPKKHGQGVRTLGIPTVADRVAQKVAALYLEPEVEPMFHEDSYGYRPKRSAHDALGVCRERCWRYDWAIDLDLQSFFDSVDHSLVLKSVAAHTDQRWILLYVERWLTAPLDEGNGTLVARDRGTPQGSAISPVLANIYLHYAFDMWMTRELRDIPFERYVDDVVLHCKSKRQAEVVSSRVAQRMADCSVEINPRKTRIVYCKDANRRGSHEHERFDFLGYTFRPRTARNNRQGKLFTCFLPAVSDDAMKAMSKTIKRWRLHLWSGKTLTALARATNKRVQGWINYYGHFYPSVLIKFLGRIDKYLVRWAMQKYKRLRKRHGKTKKFLAGVKTREPKLFAHWQTAAQANNRMMGAV
jgi:RNA-directed DNA polymerase